MFRWFKVWTSSDCFKPQMLSGFQVGAPLPRPDIPAAPLSYHGNRTTPGRLSTPRDFQHPGCPRELLAGALNSHLEWRRSPEGVRCMGERFYGILFKTYENGIELSEGAR